MFVRVQVRSSTFVRVSTLGICRNVFLIYIYVVSVKLLLLLQCKMTQPDLSYVTVSDLSLKRPFIIYPTKDTAYGPYDAASIIKSCDVDEDNPIFYRIMSWSSENGWKKKNLLLVSMKQGTLVTEKPPRNVCACTKVFFRHERNYKAHRLNLPYSSLLEDS